MEPLECMKWGNELTESGLSNSSCTVLFKGSSNARELMYLMLYVSCVCAERVLVG